MATDWLEGGKGSARDGRGWSIEGREEILLLLLLLMATDWLEEGKGSARDGGGLSIEGGEEILMLLLLLPN